MRKKILFMPEATVLAHVGRLLAVADVVDREQFEVVFAASGPHAQWIRKTGYPVHPVYTRPRDKLLARLKSGGSAFDTETLRRYVTDDLRVLREIQPDVVVGDFRASLSISAKTLDIPYACIANAVWTRYIAFKLDPPASWRLTRILGKPVLRVLSAWLEKPVFQHYAKPFNDVRCEYGLPPQRDIRDCMCSDDLTLLADIPEFFPTKDLPEAFRYIGPIVWEPDTPLPSWWTALDRTGGRQTVYLTMGSTGPIDDMKRIALPLLDEGFQVIATSLDKNDPDLNRRDRCFMGEYLPGSAMCKAADVVVCHAGNGTIYQALQCGAPVIGVPEFHDQDFNMQRVEVLGLGCAARSESDVLDAVHTVLANSGYRDNASAFQKVIEKFDGPRAAAQAIGELAMANSTARDSARARADASAPSGKTG